MLKRPEAEPAFSFSMPAEATTVSEVKISAWPTARTMLGRRSSGPA